MPAIAGFGDGGGEVVEGNSNAGVVGGEVDFVRALVAVLNVSIVPGYFRESCMWDCGSVGELSMLRGHGWGDKGYVWGCMLG